MENKIDVVIALSSYNGEKYIKQQIDSIINQKQIKLNLLIRDDGSTDKTVEIVNEYISKNNNNIRLLQGENLGVVKSFHCLINKALELFPQINFFAFADQDDIWLSTKLYNAYNRLNLENQNIPLLYCCNSFLINEENEKYGKFYKNHPNLNKSNILIYPTYQGCSMVFNRKAAQAFVSCVPTIGVHDEWMYYICNFGGKVVIDDTPRFLYRIHKGNVIGIKNEKNLKGFLHRLHRFLCSKDSSNKYNLALSFYKQFRNTLPEESKKIIEIYLNYKKSLAGKINIVFNKSFYPPVNSKMERLLEIIHIFQNRI